MQGLFKEISRKGNTAAGNPVFEFIVPFVLKYSDEFGIIYWNVQSIPVMHIKL